MIQPLPGNMLIMARFWRSPTARYKTARPGQAPPPIGGGSCLSWPRVDIVSPETSKTFPVVRPLWRSATLTSVALQPVQLRPRTAGQRWLSGKSSAPQSVPGKPSRWGGWIRTSDRPLGSLSDPGPTAALTRPRLGVGIPAYDRAELHLTTGRHERTQRFCSAQTRSPGRTLKLDVARFREIAWNRTKLPGTRPRLKSPGIRITRWVSTPVAYRLDSQQNFDPPLRSDRPPRKRQPVE